MATLYILFLFSKGAIFLAFLNKISRQNRCWVMGRLCFLIALCSVLDSYKRVLQAFLGFLLMDCVSNLKHFLTNYNDFGCGFVVFGCFSKLLNVLVLFVMFVLFLGFKVLQFGGQCKFLRKGSPLLCSNGDENDEGVKNLSVKTGTTKSKMSRVLGINNVCGGGGGDQYVEEIDEVLSSNRGFKKQRGDCFVGDEGEEEEGMECCNEDQVFDVMALRKMVKFERRRANVACSELEKERMAAASAADEAMAMILRLQNEKSSLQMQTNQLQRLVEEKQLYDQDVIQSLQWIIMKHESERSLLEDQLRMCREKLRLYVKGEEWDQFDGVCPTPSVSCSSSGGGRFEDVLISSFNLESSPM